MLDMIKRVKHSLEYDASAFDVCLMQCKDRLEFYPYVVLRQDARVRGCCIHCYEIIKSPALWSSGSTCTMYLTLFLVTLLSS